MKPKLDVHSLASALCNVNTCTYVLNSLTPLYVKFQTPVNWLETAPLGFVDGEQLPGADE